jgi:large subunit ribosomal protein L25
MSIELKANKRVVTGKKVRSLRSQGIVPANVYGFKKENQTIQIDAIELKAALRAAGTTKLVTLEVEGGQTENVLFREIIRTPDAKNYVHVDFYAVDMNAVTTAIVPLKVVGTCAPLEQGGILVLGVTAVSVEALPADIPEVIEVSIDAVQEFSELVTVADAIAPKGVKILTNPASTVVSIAETRASKASSDTEEA